MGEPPSCRGPWSHASRLIEELMRPGDDLVGFGVRARTTSATVLARAVGLRDRHRNPRKTLRAVATQGSRYR